MACKAKNVVAVLEHLTRLFPALAFIRSDNGAEFISNVQRRWCNDSGTRTAYIEPVLPWQNDFAESFNSLIRDEFLNTELFATVAEDQPRPIAIACSTTLLRAIRPSRGVCPWKQYNKLLHNNPLRSRLDQ